MSSCTIFSFYAAKNDGTPEPTRRMHPLDVHQRSDKRAFAINHLRNPVEEVREL